MGWIAASADAKDEDLPASAPPAPVASAGGGWISASAAATGDDFEPGADNAPRDDRGALSRFFSGAWEGVKSGASKAADLFTRRAQEAMDGSVEARVRMDDQAQRGVTPLDAIPGVGPLLADELRVRGGQVVRALGADETGQPRADIKAPSENLARELRGMMAPEDDVPPIMELAPGFGDIYRLGKGIASHMGSARAEDLGRGMAEAGITDLAENALEQRLIRSDEPLASAGASANLLLPADALSLGQGVVGAGKAVVKAGGPIAAVKQAAKAAGEAAPGSISQADDLARFAEEAARSVDDVQAALARAAKVREQGLAREAMARDNKALGAIDQVEFIDEMVLQPNREALAAKVAARDRIQGGIDELFQKQPEARNWDDYMGRAAAEYDNGDVFQSVATADTVASTPYSPGGTFNTPIPSIVAEAGTQGARPRNLPPPRPRDDISQVFAKLTPEAIENAISGDRAALSMLDDQIWDLQVIARKGRDRLKALGDDALKHMASGTKAKDAAKAYSAEMRGTLDRGYDRVASMREAVEQARQNAAAASSQHPLRAVEGALDLPAAVGRKAAEVFGATGLPKKATSMLSRGIGLGASGLAGGATGLALGVAAVGARHAIRSLLGNPARLDQVVGVLRGAASTNMMLAQKLGLHAGVDVSNAALATRHVRLLQSDPEYAAAFQE